MGNTAEDWRSGELYITMQGISDLKNIFYTTRHSLEIIDRIKILMHVTS